MAKETGAELFLGTDHKFEFEILNDSESAAIDITGWALSWMAKRQKSDADNVAVLTKTVAGGGIVISGTFNADPTQNTQVATVTLTDTDTASLTPASLHYELKRTDDGFETVLAYGRLRMKQGVHR